MREGDDDNSTLAQESKIELTNIVIVEFFFLLHLLFPSFSLYHIS